MTIDTTNMCSHLQKKLFEPDGVYYPIWQAMQDDETLTAVVRSRQPTHVSGPRETGETKGVKSRDELAQSMPCKEEEGEANCTSTGMGRRFSVWQVKHNRR